MTMKRWTFDAARTECAAHGYELTHGYGCASYFLRKIGGNGWAFTPYGRLSDAVSAARGRWLADLIDQFGGWLDENDDEVVRFPTPDHREKFLTALDAAKKE